MPKIVPCDDMGVLYALIAENIRRERKRQRISQAVLAEMADISVDTVRNVESGRKAMNLSTYLRIVQALETTPMALMHEEQRDEYMERFLFLMAGRGESEIEFALHMVEHLLKGRDRYLE